MLALRPAQGTSLAAPYVSGALALLASIAPGVTLEQARALLADTAVDLGPSGRDRHYGPACSTSWRCSEPIRRARGLPYHRCAAGRPGRFPALGADSVAVAPANADPRTLVVRWSGPSRRRAARGAVAAELRDRHRIGEVSAGDGEYSLVQLQPDQDLVLVKARLEADPAVASVHFNGRYRPTMTAAAESVGQAVEAAEGVHGGAYRGVGKGSPTAPAQQLVDAQGG